MNLNYIHMDSGRVILVSDLPIWTQEIFKTISRLVSKNQNFQSVIVSDDDKEDDFIKIVCLDIQQQTILFFGETKSLSRIHEYAQTSIWCIYEDLIRSQVQSFREMQPDRPKSSLELLSIQAVIRC